MSRYLISMFAVTLFFSSSNQAREVVPVDAGKRDRFLLLDSRVIEKVENGKLFVGTVMRHRANPLFGEDQPWEKRFDNLYGNVIFDSEEKLYKCWYSPFIVDLSAKGMTLEQRKQRYTPPRGREMGICYATSKDGILWEKPKLGLVEYDGSKANNIVWRGPHGAGVFKDEHETDARRRYKSIFQGLHVSLSSDGLHWGKPRACEGVQVRGDTHNNALWAPTLGKYVGFTRTMGKLGREVARIESADFVHWSKEEVVLKGITRDLQPYAMPVFFHGGVYIGLVAIHAQPPVDRVWTELAWSPDTRIWYRIAPGTPLIPCADKELDYDYGCVYPCAYPIFLKDEIRLYYGGSDYLHFGWRTGHLCLATLRPDGFAGYKQEGKDRAAVITTTPFPFFGQEIQITADVEKQGSIKVIVLDKEEKLLAKGETVLETLTDGCLKLQKKIASQEIRLRFELTNAQLYSFSLGKQKPIN